VLDALDEQIEELEERLKKAQPMIDELNSLKRTRATLLDERRVTSGGGRANAQLSLEQVIQDIRDNGPSTAAEIADRVHVDATIVRSHLHRYKDRRYAQNGDGNWRLIGEDTADEDEGEEDDE
jgi:transcriptional regulator GlxA family with amidase domain